MQSFDKVKLKTKGLKQNNSVYLEKNKVNKKINQNNNKLNKSLVPKLKASSYQIAQSSNFRRKTQAIK